MILLPSLVVEQSEVLGDSGEVIAKRLDISRLQEQRSLVEQCRHLRRRSLGQIEAKCRGISNGEQNDQNLE
jgi:hypothetical protein